MDPGSVVGGFGSSRAAIDAKRRWIIAEKAEQERWYRRISGSTSIATLALIVSIVTLLLTYSPWAKVAPIEPSGYVIVRGVQTAQGDFPSDHFVLPLEWQNGKGRPVLIRQPELEFHKLSGGSETGEEISFLLAGEYPATSNDAFIRTYARSISPILGARSVTLNVLVFHVRDWFDPDSEHYQFRFRKDQKYRVELTYLQDSEEKRRSVTLLEELPINASVEDLSLYARAFMLTRLKGLRLTIFNATVTTVSAQVGEFGTV